MAYTKQLTDKDGNVIYPDVGFSLDDVIYSDDQTEVIDGIIDPYSYSTNETIIGKWVDGKPLYRRVFNATSPANVDTTTTILTLDNNVGAMTKLYGMLYNATVPLSIPLPSVLSNDNYFRLTFNPTTKAVQMGLHNSQYTNCNCVIIAEYIKTTD